MAENEKKNPKHLRVTMDIYLKSEEGFEQIQKWERHIDWAIEIDSWSEIDHIENVKVEKA